MKRITALAVVVLLAACTSPAPKAAPSPTPSACVSSVRDDPLPEWARAGFTGDRYPPYVLSVRGDIAAILFGHPLTHPARPDRSNKILWVSRLPLEPGDPMKIEARGAGAGEPVLREVGGPGPSIIDLPAAGCWRLQLAWSGRTDEIDLEYVPR